MWERVEDDRYGWGKNVPLPREVALGW
jgi:hypothetical protein